MRLHVETQSDGLRDELPVRFRLGDSTIEVTDVLDRWHDDDAVLFRVRGSDGHLYVLKGDYPPGSQSRWGMISFTRRDSPGMGPNTVEVSQLLH